jgi:hypothetical protein
MQAATDTRDGPRSGTVSLQTKPVVIWGIAAVAGVVGAPSAGFLLLGGAFDKASEWLFFPARAGSSVVNACGTPERGLWRLYAAHVWAIELGIGVVLGCLVVGTLVFAARRRLLVVVALAIPAIILSTVPWVIQYDRSSDQPGGRIFNCHEL